MESSRIFVKNLPPNITEADFRKHFSQGREITDVKVIPSRRIGFVGFKTPQDAAKAVKYFNRSYIRMSRIAVDLAKPVADPSLPKNAEAKPNSRNPGLKPNAAATAPKENAKEDGDTKKRKRDAAEEAADPKLQEFLEVMNPGKKLRDAGDFGHEESMVEATTAPAEESDDEYEALPIRKPEPQVLAKARENVPVVAPVQHDPKPPQEDSEGQTREAPAEAVDASDESWLRSRTNRLLDLADPDDTTVPVRAPAREEPPKETTGGGSQDPQPLPDVVPEGDDEAPIAHQDKDSALDLISKTARIFIRNLSYTTTEDDIREHFGTFGEIEEVHLPVDNRGKSKGFALVLFDNAEDAIKAFQAMDGSTFQGRIIHLLAAKRKREQKLDEFALSQLPLKKQNLLRKKEAASNSFNWNALYMSQDAVNESISRRLGISKAEFLDPTASDAGVKQAVAESQLIQETKAYFAANGVDLNAFKAQHRKGDKAILVKNFAYGTSMEELRKLFEEHGTVLRVLMPPAGTIAILEMVDVKAAFSRLAYRRFKESILFLEKAPHNIFTVPVVKEDKQTTGTQKLSVTDLLERDEKHDQPETSSLYVGNLNFSTTTADLAEAFKPLDGFVSAQVKMKSNPKKPGQQLSMGFGFVAFRSKEQAMSALKVMDGTPLAGHKLAIKASHRGLDAAEERRREDLAKKAGGQRTKLIIKNLPFESTRADVRKLFSTYGQLRSVRVPKKFDHSSRGYAFIDFVSPREAENAMNALADVHVLGRRLVLEWADADEVDPEEEIRKMEGKMQKQVNKVTLQQLTGAGRAKVKIGDEDNDEA